MTKNDDILLSELATILDKMNEENDSPPDGKLEIQFHVGDRVYEITLTEIVLQKDL